MFSPAGRDGRPRARYPLGVTTSSTFVQVQVEGGIAEARILVNSVGEREAGVLKDELIDAARKGAGRLVLDMSEVKVLGSVGLGMMVTVTNECRGLGGALVVFGISEPLLQMIKLTKLDKFLKIKKDRAAAIKAAS